MMPSGLRLACVLGTLILRAASSEISEMLMYEDIKWLESTESHAFLSSCCQGTIDDGAFNQWLVQDRLFVEEFQKFASHVSGLAAAQDPEAGAILKGGEAAIDDELIWFSEKIAERNADGNAPMLSANKEYTVFMKDVTEQMLSGSGNWPLAISVFFGIEKVYQRAWRNVRFCKDSPAWLKEYAARWGSDLFEVYVNQLEKLADKAIESASPAERDHISTALQTMLTHEVEFWSMAYEASKAEAMKTEL